MKLIVGLGNPGAQYSGHRHNIGFMALDRIAERHRLSPWRKRFQALTSEGDIGGAKVLLLKPETYMNESGRAVGEAMRFLKIDPADVIVLHDELDLEPGRLKHKIGGGNAGHNGLRSISAHIGNDYPRLRLGIGHPGHKDLVSGYVLHDFAKADRDWLAPLLDAIADTLPALLAGKPALFVSDVARGTGQSQATAAPLVGAQARDKPVRPSSGSQPAPRHPSGDRANKRDTALAENLKKFLARKTSGSNPTD
ncbi:MAG: aminoacyl-tRNA hydrolase [Hyphomicrobiaceae bacterium]|nr:aminoacyl-tRNA hydrolase [Hyphomicrobiaceae bacterium]